MANYLLRDIPDDLLKEFKGACALKGTTMKDRIIELIRIDVVRTLNEKRVAKSREAVKKWLFKDELKKRGGEKK